MSRLACLLSLLLACAGTLSAAFSLGRPAAVKHRVEKLDEKVRARTPAASSAASNQAPTAAVPVAVSSTVAASGLARVSISASDPDGDTLSYVWTSTAGTIGGTGASVNWLAPSSEGTYALSCVVSDGTDSVARTVTLTVVQAGTLKWVFSGSAAINLKTAIGPDGTVYAVDTAGTLYAVNPDGTQKWVFNTENTDAIDFPPLVAADGTVYVLAVTTKAYAVNPSGTTKWGPVTVGSVGVSDPPVLGPDGTIYMFDGWANELNSMDPATGAWVSTFTALSGIKLPPVTGADGTLYIVSTSDMLYALPAGGVLADSTVTAVTNISRVPAIGADGSFYWVDSDTFLSGNGPDGSSLWPQYVLGGGSVSEAPVTGRDGTIYLIDNGPTLHSVSSTTGAGGPFTALSAPAFTPQVGPDGALYVVDSATDIYSVNPAGSTRWGPLSVSPSASAVNSRPVAASDGTVYFGGDDGNLYAVYSTAVLP